MKVLIIVRGFPGSGKSLLITDILSIARNDETTQISLDQYRDHHYQPSTDDWKNWRHQAEVECEKQMVCGKPLIFVHGVFSVYWEFRQFRKLASSYGYRIHELVVENRHGGKSVHTIPPEAMERIRRVFEIRLEPQPERNP